MSLKYPPSLRKVLGHPPSKHCCTLEQITEWFGLLGQDSMRKNEYIMFFMHARVHLF